MEFRGDYQKLDNFGNGASWARSDGPLGRKYIIKRVKDHRGRIEGVKLEGYNYRPLNNQTPNWLRRKVVDGARCVVLGVSAKEADHKDGRKDLPRTLNETDYQPMSKGANDAKRTHCGQCQDTRKRFDARRLGYSAGWTVGDSEWRGTCLGCYWFDPHEFNAEISQGWSAIQNAEATGKSTTGNNSGIAARLPTM